ncbi:hypothetical protein U1Q18_025698, partial [Sarracenia purpurea var. burkii]
GIAPSLPLVRKSLGVSYVGASEPNQNNEDDVFNSEELEEDDSEDEDQDSLGNVEEAEVNNNTEPSVGDK